MTFKTLSIDDAARIAAVPLDYEWDSWIGNGFWAATDREHPRLADALDLRLDSRCFTHLLGAASTTVNA